MREARGKPSDRISELSARGEGAIVEHHQQLWPRPAKLLRIFGKAAGASVGGEARRRRGLFRFALPAQFRQPLGGAPLGNSAWILSFPFDRGFGQVGSDAHARIAEGEKTPSLVFASARSGKAAGAARSLHHRGITRSRHDRSALFERPARY